MKKGRNRYAWKNDVANLTRGTIAVIPSRARNLSVEVWITQAHQRDQKRLWVILDFVQDDNACAASSLRYQRRVDNLPQTGMLRVA